MTSMIPASACALIRLQNYLVSGLLLMVALLAAGPALAAPSVAAGNSHVMAIRSDGSLWCWGWNKAGQVGDGTTTDRLFPVRIEAFRKVVAAAPGIAHSLVLLPDGSVQAWGEND